MGQGLNTQSERLLQILPETTHGTYNAAATPIVLTNFKHEYQEANQFDNWRAPGVNEDEFNAVIEQMVTVNGELVLYYNLFDHLLQYMLPTPSGADDATAGGARTRVWKRPLTGRIDRKSFTLEEGIAASCRRATYGLIPSFGITSARGNNGRTRGQLSIVAQKATEGVAMTANGTIVTPQPVLPNHWKVYRASSLAGLSAGGAFVGNLSKFELQLADMVAPYWAKDRSDTYTQHVDGEAQTSSNFTIPTDNDNHCKAMMDGSKEYISKPHWFRYEAIPTNSGVVVANTKIMIDIYASVGENVGLSANGNIEERTFPLKPIRNAADGFSFRITTVVPSP
jgi:hypothetical protein